MNAYKLTSLGILAFLVSSNAHYLLSVINSPTLKLLGYGSVLVLAMMGVVLDDAIADYLNLQSKGFVAVCGVVATCIFLGGSYRAFNLNNQLEGYLLAVLIACFWLVLLAIYIRLLIPTSGR